MTTDLLRRRRFFWCFPYLRFVAAFAAAHGSGRLQFDCCEFDWCPVFAFGSAFACLFKEDDGHLGSLRLIDGPVVEGKVCIFPLDVPRRGVLVDVRVTGCGRDVHGEHVGSAPLHRKVLPSVR